MNTSKEELARQYESLSNKRLEQIVQAGTFSIDAVEAAVDELRSRGVDVSRTAVVTARQCESLSNSQLEAIVQAGTYSQAAVEFAIEELRSRGVEVASFEKGDQHEAAENAAEQSPESEPAVDLVTVYRTNNPLIANVLRGLLESEGVFAYVWGHNLGVTHVLLSMGTGGMRVQVREDQLAQAKEIVAKFERGEYRIQDESE